MEFDALGRKKKITYPNKLETAFAFDGVDRLTEINTPGVGSRAFDYDETSNISQVKFESGQFDFSYDQNSALIGAYYKGGEGIGDEKFVWDNSGNRMNGTRDSASNSIRPRPILINNGLFEDAEPMPTNGVGRYSFIYDMHGNVVKKYDNEANVYYLFEYDADNKLVYAEKYNNDSLELKAKYTYDGLGRRVEKEVTKGSIVTRKSYVYNGENILLEYNTSGATPVETAKYIGTGAIDDNLMTIKGGKGYFYHKDHLGSINAITNDVGEVIQKNQYSAFGKIVSIKDKNRKELGIASALDQPFYYAGREYDEELELYYYRARSYDPIQGRFMQKDPIGLRGGDTNLYRYVENTPTRFTDPSGLLLNDNTGVVELLLQTGNPEVIRILNDLQQSSTQINISNVSNLRSDGVPLFGQANTPALGTGLVNIEIDVQRNMSSERGQMEFADTGLHELIHVHNAMDVILQSNNLYGIEESYTRNRTLNMLGGALQCQ